MAAALQHILFMDIETVPQQPDYTLLPETWQQLWNKKAEILLRNNNDDTPADIYARAGIYAEFGKVVCISCGVISGHGDAKQLTIKSFAGDDEKLLLAGFAQMLQKWSNGEPRFLCAHNGKEFDFPYLSRRMIINDVPLPNLLNTAGKKPWEVGHIDTMELWKFGDFKSYTSLNLLAVTLGIPTPKDDIDGSQVWQVYWQEKNLPRIVTYCQKDVVTAAQIYLRLNGHSLLKEGAVEIKQ